MVIDVHSVDHIVLVGTAKHPHGVSKIAITPELSGRYRLGSDAAPRPHQE